MTSEFVSMILRTVSREEAFYFFTSIGNYVGVSASSLREFSERVRDVNSKSLEFHLYRGDFEKWIAEVLHDNELARAVRMLQDSALAGDALRSQLGVIVARRFKQLIAQRDLGKP